MILKKENSTRNLLTLNKVSIGISFQSVLIVSDLVG